MGPAEQSRPWVVRHLERNFVFPSIPKWGLKMTAQQMSLRTQTRPPCSLLALRVGCQPNKVSPIVDENPTARGMLLWATAVRKRFSSVTCRRIRVAGPGHVLAASCDEGQRWCRLTIVSRPPSCRVKRHPAALGEKYPALCCVALRLMPCCCYYCQQQLDLRKTR